MKEMVTGYFGIDCRAKNCFILVRQKKEELSKEKASLSTRLVGDILWTWRDGAIFRREIFMESAMFRSKPSSMGG